MIVKEYSSFEFAFKETLSKTQSYEWLKELSDYYSNIQSIDIQDMKKGDWIVVFKNKKTQPLKPIIMQTILHKLGILIAVLLVSIPAYAYDFDVDGIYYNLISPIDLTCEVTEGDVKYEGDIVIPSEVTYNNRQLSVIQIGNSAFSGCSSLTSVTIPNSVTTIEEWAFRGCTSLTLVTIPNSVTEIGQSAFRGCTSLTSVTIPNSVTEIRADAFSGCTSLTSVDIPDSVTYIGESAFEKCTSLTSVDIPDSVTYIGESAFRECTSLTSVDISDSVKTIRKYSFYWCTSLTSVTIGNSVTEIGEYAFSDCTSLTSVDIPDSVTEIRLYAFNYCSALTSVTIGKSLGSFGEYYIEGCNSITKLRILHSDYSISLYGDWLNRIKELFIDRPLFRENIEFSDLEKLELGGSIESCQIKDMHKLDKLTSIESYALVPPKLPEMSNIQYMNLNVFVPEEALDAYLADPVWGKFWNLQASGVEGVKVDSKKEVTGRFDMNGRAVSEDYKGLMIVRFSDGSCRKIFNR